MLVHSSVRRIFEREGAGNSENLRLMKTRMKIFHPKTKSVFPCPKLGEDQKQRSSLKFSTVFGQKKVFAHRFCAQTFCPSYKGGAMLQFCILFYANYTILATQRGEPWHNAPPLNTPLLVLYVHKTVRKGSEVANFRTEPWISPGLYVGKNLN